VLFSERFQACRQLLVLYPLRKGSSIGLLRRIGGCSAGNSSKAGAPSSALFPVGRLLLQNLALDPLQELEIQYADYAVWRRE
jgi:hypothetical protein